jgi:hypothetical protein
MEKIVLDIKKPQRITKLLNSLGWVMIVFSCLLFVVAEGKILGWGELFGLPILLGLLFFLINYLFFPSKKSGELFLTDKEIKIFLMGKQKELPFEEITKITVILARNVGKFHRDWWPITDIKEPYHSSVHNYLFVRLKRRKVITVRYALSTREQEQYLLTILKENSEKYGFRLKVK